MVDLCWQAGQQSSPRRSPSRRAAARRKIAPLDSNWGTNLEVRITLAAVHPRHHRARFHRQLGLGQDSQIANPSTGQGNLRRTILDSGHKGHTWGCLDDDGSGIVCSGVTAQQEKTCSTFRKAPLHCPTREEAEKAEGLKTSKPVRRVSGIAALGLLQSAAFGPAETPTLVRSSGQRSN
jgi:hypothetical protein